MNNVEKIALKAHPEPKLSNYPDTLDGYENYLENCCLEGYARQCFAEGWRKAIEELESMVKRYEKDSDACFEQSEANLEATNCAFWDGYKLCAINILREIEEELK